MKIGLLIFEGDEPTGYYGELTEAAVRKFQAAHGLPVTGEADADTQNAIEAAARFTIIRTSLAGADTPLP
jgi:peptidoglycan hydrolase-like protein with peptidoglycan-binding domain